MNKPTNIEAAEKDFEHSVGIVLSEFKDKIELCETETDISDLKFEVRGSLPAEVREHSLAFDVFLSMCNRRLVTILSSK